ncbi:MAG TPA: prephenate dehydratase [Terriglobales bacterium]|nr:prephenate dehydratase [Terriglobales bacterium]
MKIAIQGELGSFSHEAARHMVPGCTVVPCARSVEVFDRVENRSVNAAVIPIENSLAGSVAEHFDLLLARDVFIQREFQLRIIHNLIAAPGVKPAQITRVYSHPVALEQCRDFFRRHPAFEPAPFYDTAGSVKYILEKTLKNSAAIASRRAATVYKGRILASGIEDDKRNFTRFFLIRTSSRILPRANKTSIAFRLKNLPGSLFQALGAFAHRSISLSKIESRPVRGRPWEYVFYADYLRGHDRIAQAALAELEQNADYVKVLGVYPASGS